MARRKARKMTEVTRLKLMEFMKSKKEDWLARRPTLEAAAFEASEALGFEVSPDTIMRYRQEDMLNMNWSTRRPKAEHDHDPDCIVARVDLIEDALFDLYDLCGKAPSATFAGDRARRNSTPRGKLFGSS